MVSRTWTVAQIITRNLEKKIAGIYNFILLITTAMIMTMFDLTSDPMAATISNQWVWKNGGDYYGVPISNYFGWFFVCRNKSTESFDFVVMNW